VSRLIDHGYLDARNHSAARIRNSSCNSSDGRVLRMKAKASGEEKSQRKELEPAAV
jgi:hypothetical protein